MQYQCYAACVSKYSDQFFMPSWITQLNECGPYLVTSQPTFPQGDQTSSELCPKSRSYCWRDWWYPPKKSLCAGEPGQRRKGSGTSSFRVDLWRANSPLSSWETSTDEVMYIFNAVAFIAPVSWTCFKPNNMLEVKNSAVEYFPVQKLRTGSVHWIVCICLPMLSFPDCYSKK